TGNATTLTSDNVLIDTVASPPRSLLGAAGNTQVALQWLAPANPGDTGDPDATNPDSFITSYTVTASPCPGGGASCGILPVGTSTPISATPNAFQGGSKI